MTEIEKQLTIQFHEAGVPRTQYKQNNAYFGPGIGTERNTDEQKDSQSLGNKVAKGATVAHMRKTPQKEVNRLNRRRKDKTRVLIQCGALPNAGNPPSK